jgi:DNA-binding IclR family transcriptional regulator
VAVLDFLARHPHDRFGVSELARRLGLSKPTCLGIVGTLAAADYLVRDAQDKTYRLGPALISLGHTAQESMRVNPAAREELRRLSSTYDTTAALSAVIDDRITLLELVGPPGADVGVRVGQSYPFAPPVGLMFVLWDDDALRTWLAKEPTIPLRTDTDRLDRVIDECRTTGYLVELLTPGGRRLYALMAGMSSALPDELRALLGELVSDIGERVYLRSEANASGPRQRHDISVISAPVYDHHQRQAMVLSLQIGRALSDGEITRCARGLMTAASTLTAQLGGIRG